MSWMPSHSNPNLLHNATFVIDQANEGAAITMSGLGGNFYGCDLWEGNFFSDQSATATIQRVLSNSIATGCPFKYAIQCTMTVAQTEVGGPYTGPDVNIHHSLENPQVQSLLWGSGQGLPVTISFWALSNNTGIYDFNIWNQGAGGNNWDYTLEFTIPTANTWLRYVFTIPPPPQNSGWYNTSTNSTFSLQCRWALFAASNYFLGIQNSWQNSPGYASANLSNTFMLTAGNYFQLAGPKLEIGYAATPFATPITGDELEVCQRYYEKSYAPGTAVGTATTTNAILVLNNAITTANPIEQLGATSFKSYKYKVPTITTYSPNSGASGNAFNLVNSSDEGTTLNRSSNTSFSIYMANSVSSVADYIFHYVADARPAP